jgi:glycosyltransferase involved in cell wall biosynthesis
LRIAFPYPAYWPYSRRGVERAIHDLSAYLSGRGHQVHIITSTPGRPRVAYEGEVKVTYLREVAHPLIHHYKPVLGVYGLCLKMTRILLRERPDVMHVWSYSGVITAPLLSGHFGVPYLMHFMMPHQRRRGTLDDLVFTRMVRGAGCVAALTPQGAEAVSVAFGSGCEVLPPPVDLAIFKPCAARDPRRPTILFPSDMADGRKGGRLLLRAWNRIHRERPGARLVLAGPYGMVGWFPYEFWKTMLSGLDLVVEPAARDAIEVRGPGAVETLPQWYSEACVTVLPSYAEAFGMVLTESLACGTPVVASSDAGPGEILTEPGVGRTVDIRGPDDIEDPARAEQLAEAVLEAIDLAARPATARRCREWAGRWALDAVGPREEMLLERARAGAGAELTAMAAGGKEASADAGAGWW